MDHESPHLTDDKLIAFHFIRDFSRFEHDLKRSGFLTSRYGYAEVDWDRYAKCMGERFDNIGININALKTPSSTS